MKLRFFLTFLLLASHLCAQSVNYPDIDRKVAKDVYITSVHTNDYNTIVNFVYVNSDSKARYILLHPPGNSDAYFIRANGTRYELVGTQNIAAVDRITLVYPGQKHEFSAWFEKLPYYTTSFDLIEGLKGDWDFFGIHLNKKDEEEQSSKFRIDHNYIAVYDPDKDEWGDWQSGNNTFVVNINEQGDIAHIKANGDKVIYKRLSGVEEGTLDNGKHYQLIKALDENGDVFRFQLFDDIRVGLKMMWGSFIIQFAYF